MLSTCLKVFLLTEKGTLYSMTQDVMTSKGDIKLYNDFVQEQDKGLMA